MDFTKDEAATLERILRWRRDVRHFRTDALTEPQVVRLQQAMDLAPSVGNARPWRVIRVEDAALRQAVHDNFIAANAEAAQGYEGQRLSDYNRLKLAGLDAAPLQLAVFTVTDPAEGTGWGGKACLPRSMPRPPWRSIRCGWRRGRTIWGWGWSRSSILWRSNAC
jgi:5,6-dimethylbenzimidazole synthase